MQMSDSQDLRSFLNRLKKGKSTFRSSVFREAQHETDYLNIFDPDLELWRKKKEAEIIDKEKRLQIKGTKKEGKTYTVPVGDNAGFANSLGPLRPSVNDQSTKNLQGKVKQKTITNSGYTLSGAKYTELSEPPKRPVSSEKSVKNGQGLKQNLKDSRCAKFEVESGALKCPPKVHGQKSTQNIKMKIGIGCADHAELSEPTTKTVCKESSQRSGIRKKKKGPSTGSTSAQVPGQKDSAKPSGKKQENTNKELLKVCSNKCTVACNVPAGLKDSPKPSVMKKNAKNVQGMKKKKISSGGSVFSAGLKVSPKPSVIQKTEKKVQVIKKKKKSNSSECADHAGLSDPLKTIVNSQTLKNQGIKMKKHLNSNESTMLRTKHSESNATKPCIGDNEVIYGEEASVDVIRHQFFKYQTVLSDVPWQDSSVKNPPMKQKQPGCKPAFSSGIRPSNYVLKLLALLDDEPNVQPVEPIRKINSFPKRKQAVSETFKDLSSSKKPRIESKNTVSKTTSSSGVHIPPASLGARKPVNIQSKELKRNINTFKAGGETLKSLSSSNRPSLTVKSKKPGKTISSQKSKQHPKTSLKGPSLDNLWSLASLGDRPTAMDVKEDKSTTNSIEANKDTICSSKSCSSENSDSVLKKTPTKISLQDQKSDRLNSVVCDNHKEDSSNKSNHSPKDCSGEAISKFAQKLDDPQMATVKIKEPTLATNITQDGNNSDNSGKSRSESNDLIKDQSSNLVSSNSVVDEQSIGTSEDSISVILDDDQNGSGHSPSTEYKDISFVAFDDNKTPQSDIIDQKSNYAPVIESRSEGPANHPSAFAENSLGNDDGEEKSESETCFSVEEHPINIGLSDSLVDQKLVITSDDPDAVVSDDRKRNKESTKCNEHISSADDPIPLSMPGDIKIQDITEEVDTGSHIQSNCASVEGLSSEEPENRLSVFAESSSCDDDSGEKSKNVIEEHPADLESNDVYINQRLVDIPEESVAIMSDDKRENEFEGCNVGNPSMDDPTSSALPNGHKVQDDLFAKEVDTGSRIVNNCISVIGNLSSVFEEGSLDYEDDDSGEESKSEASFLVEERPVDHESSDSLVDHESSDSLVDHKSSDSLVDQQIVGTSENSAAAAASGNIGPVLLGDQPSSNVQSKEPSETKDSVSEFTSPSVDRLTTDIFKSLAMLGDRPSFNAQSKDSQKISSQKRKKADDENTSKNRPSLSNLWALAALGDRTTAITYTKGKSITACAEINNDNDCEIEKLSNSKNSDSVVLENCLTEDYSSNLRSSDSLDYQQSKADDFLTAISDDDDDVDDISDRHGSSHWKFGMESKNSVSRPNTSRDRLSNVNLNQQSRADDFFTAISDDDDDVDDISNRHESSHSKFGMESNNSVSRPNTSRDRLSNVNLNQQSRADDFFTAISDDDDDVDDISNRHESSHWKFGMESKNSVSRPNTSRDRLSNVNLNQQSRADDFFTAISDDDDDVDDISNRHESSHSKFGMESKNSVSRPNTSRDRLSNVNLNQQSRADDFFTAISDDDDDVDDISNRHESSHSKFGMESKNSVSRPNTSRDRLSNVNLNQQSRADDFFTAISDDDDDISNRHESSHWKFGMESKNSVSRPNTSRDRLSNVNLRSHAIVDDAPPFNILSEKPVDTKDCVSESTFVPGDRLTADIFKSIAMLGDRPLFNVQSKEPSQKISSQKRKKAGDEDSKTSKDRPSLRNLWALAALGDRTTAMTYTKDKSITADSDSDNDNNCENVELSNSKNFQSVPETCLTKDHLRSSFSLNQQSDAEDSVIDISDDDDNDDISYRRGSSRKRFCMMSEKSVPKPTASKKSVPKPAASKKSVPKPASKKSVPKPAASKKSVPKPAASKKSVPKPAASKKSVPKPAASSGDHPSSRNLKSHTMVLDDPSFSVQSEEHSGTKDSVCDTTPSSDHLAVDIFKSLAMLDDRTSSSGPSDKISSQKIKKAGAKDFKTSSKDRPSLHNLWALAALGDRTTAMTYTKGKSKTASNKGNNLCENSELSNSDSTHSVLENSRGKISVVNQQIDKSVTLDKFTCNKTESSNIVHLPKDRPAGDMQKFLASLDARVKVMKSDKTTSTQGISDCERISKNQINCLDKNRRSSDSLFGQLSVTAISDDSDDDINHYQVSSNKKFCKKSKSFVSKSGNSSGDHVSSDIFDVISDDSDDDISHYHVSSNKKFCKKSKSFVSKSGNSSGDHASSDIFRSLAVLGDRPSLRVQSKAASTKISSQNIETAGDKNPNTSSKGRPSLNRWAQAVLRDHATTTAYTKDKKSITTSTEANKFDYFANEDSSDEDSHSTEVTPSTISDQKTAELKNFNQNTSGSFENESSYRTNHSAENTIFVPAGANFEMFSAHRYPHTTSMQLQTHQFPSDLARVHPQLANVQDCSDAQINTSQVQSSQLKGVPLRNDRQSSDVQGYSDRQMMSDQLTGIQSGGIRQMASVQDYSDRVNITHLETGQVTNDESVKRLANVPSWAHPITNSQLLSGQLASIQTQSDRQTLDVQSYSNDQGYWAHPMTISQLKNSQLASDQTRSDSQMTVVQGNSDRAVTSAQQTDQIEKIQPPSNQQLVNVQSYWDDPMTISQLQQSGQLASIQTRGDHQKADIQDYSNRPAISAQQAKVQSSNDHQLANNDRGYWAHPMTSSQLQQSDQLASIQTRGDHQIADVQDYIDRPITGAHLQSGHVTTVLARGNREMTNDRRYQKDNSSAQNFIAASDDSSNAVNNLASKVYQVMTSSKINIPDLSHKHRTYNKLPQASVNNSSDDQDFASKEYTISNSKFTEFNTPYSTRGVVNVENKTVYKTVSEDQSLSSARSQVTLNDHQVNASVQSEGLGVKPSRFPENKKSHFGTSQTLPLESEDVQRSDAACDNANRVQLNYYSQNSQINTNSNIQRSATGTRCSPISISGYYHRLVAGTRQAGGVSVENSDKNVGWRKKEYSYGSTKTPSENQPTHSILRSRDRDNKQLQNPHVTQTSRYS